MPSFWSENVRRLLGMHSVTAQEASKFLDVSPQAISEWISKTRKEGTRQPNVPTLLRIAQFFELPAGDLVDKDFATLLEAGAGDPERFRRVELKISKGRRKLTSVPMPTTPKRGSAKVDKTGRS
jgi:transcriptional regulator with XRE-family HTH domain